MHAFGICWGLVLLATPAFAALGAGSWRGGAALLATLLLYAQVFLPAKQRLIPDARRKLLIDFGLFVGPVFYGLGLAFGLRMDALLDSVSLAMPLGIVVLRSGCFLTGCCHGAAARWGPRYSRGGHRVLPLPLLEAVAAGFLLVVAAGSMLVGVAQPVLALSLMGAYASYRFGSEFFRARSGRYRVRRWFHLSLTQWMCGLLASALAMGVVL